MCTKRRNSAFTLLELMLSVALLAAVSTLAYLSFSTITSAWKRGMVLGEDLHHGDFVMEQLAMALRSAYYLDTKDKPGTYGFTMEDGGSGEAAGDKISWVKLGSALVGSDSSLGGSPHRTEFWVGEDSEGRKAAAVRAWRLQGQPENFVPEDEEPVFLSTRVVGFNCRVAYRKIDDDIEWLDEWIETNRLPTTVELSLYLEPLEEGQSPVEVKRVLGIPVAPLSWR